MEPVPVETITAVAGTFNTVADYMLDKTEDGEWSGVQLFPRIDEGLPYVLIVNNAADAIPPEATAAAAPAHVATPNLSFFRVHEIVARDDLYFTDAAN